MVRNCFTLASRYIALVQLLGLIQQHLRLASDAMFQLLQSTKTEILIGNLWYGSLLLTNIYNTVETVTPWRNGLSKVLDNIVTANSRLRFTVAVVLRPARSVLGEGSAAASAKLPGVLQPPRPQTHQQIIGI